MKYKYHKELLKVFEKLAKKDNNLYKQIINKISDIKNTDDIEHYKNLKKPLQNFKRVKITIQFVLIFRYIKSEEMILFRYFDHRDNIYKKDYD